MESAHHFSSKPDCNSTADVFSLILRTGSFLYAICLGSQDLPKFEGTVSVNDFRFF